MQFQMLLRTLSDLQIFDAQIGAPGSGIRGEVSKLQGC
jgi:hypothetical protein